MNRMTIFTRRVLAAAVLVTLGGALVACGDDNKAAPTNTTAALESVADWGARVNTECPGSDPGFDPFMTAHPEPTAEDWAGFLAQPRDMVIGVSKCISDSNPPVEVTDKVAAVVAAMDVVAADLDEALRAAQAGDLETTNKWITQMHDIDQPKIDVAIGLVGLPADG